MFLKEALQTVILVLGFHLSHGYSKLAQSTLLLTAQAGGNLHVDGNVLVAPSAAAQFRDALATQAEGSTGLSAGGQSVLHLAVDGGDLQLGAHGCLEEGDGMLIKHGGSLTMELGMRLDAYTDDQIAGGAAVLTGVALAPQGHCLTIINTVRNGNHNALLALDTAGTVTGLTGLVNDLTCAVTLAAGGGAGKGHATHALLDSDSAGAPTLRAGLCGGACCTTASMTLVTVLGAGEVDLLLATESGLLKADGHAGPQALALLGAIPA